MMGRGKGVEENAVVSVAVSDVAYHTYHLPPSPLTILRKLQCSFLLNPRIKVTHSHLTQPPEVVRPTLQTRVVQRRKTPAIRRVDGCPRARQQLRRNRSREVWTHN